MARAARQIANLRVLRASVVKRYAIAPPRTAGIRTSRAKCYTAIAKISRSASPPAAPAMTISSSPTLR